MKVTIISLVKTEVQNTACKGESLFAMLQKQRHNLLLENKEYNQDFLHCVFA